MKSISLMLLAAVLSTACATIGSQPSDTPPRLISTLDGGIGWNNPGAFGPVPQALAANGSAVCAALNKGSQTFRALGYHPAALDLDGKPIQGGGFFCVKD